MAALVPRLRGERAGAHDETGGAAQVDVRAGETTAHLAARAAVETSTMLSLPHVIELVWPSPGVELATHAPPRAGDGAVEAMARAAEAAVDALLARGPRGGWCVSTAHVSLPPALLALGGVHSGSATFCFNVTRLLML